MAPKTTPEVAKIATVTPYSLDQAQVLKATRALTNHIQSENKRKEERAEKKNLLADADGSPADDADNGEAVWLIVTTKKHIVDKKRLKPGKILLPHTLNRSESTTICLITPDPQRAFKDVLSHPTFPVDLAKKIRIIGIAKIKTRYKSFESRRQLLSEYDVFLADDRIVALLPKLLGKIMYESSKRPVPIRLEGYGQEDSTGKRTKPDKSSDSKAVAAPITFAKEIEKALSSARVHLSPSVNSAIKIGFTNFTPLELAENVAAVVDAMVAKYVTKGWRNIRSMYVKGTNSAPLPVWLADELWVDNEDVIEDVDADKAKKLESQKNKKRKGKALEKKPADGSESFQGKKKRIDETEGFSKEMAERRQKLRQQKEEAREEAGRKVAAKMLEMPSGSSERAEKKEEGKEKKLKKASERALVVGVAA